MRLFLLGSMFTLCSLSVGCAATLQVASYHPRGATFDANHALLWEATARTVLEQGWHIEQIDESTGLLEALTPTEAFPEYSLRHRWRFVVADRQVKASLRLEARFGREGDPWQSSSMVCGSYEYRREHEQLGKIKDLVLEFLAAARDARAVALQLKPTKKNEELTP